MEENMPSALQQPIIFPIRQIYAVNSKTCLILGTFLNLILIWLVLKKTPKEMKVYSKIVLQTCFCDLAVLVTSDLVQPILVVSKGISMVLENGLTTSMPAPWNIIIYNCWFYNSYFVSVGIVVQFIYRYLTLCRNVEIKMRHYFGMLAAAATIEGILLGFFFWIGYPPNGARVEDEQLLRILGVPLDQPQIPWEMRPALHGDKNDLRWIIWICSFVVFSTLCYTIIWFCATRMLHFVRKNLKMDGTSMRVVEVNRQMMRNMIIQASIPIFNIFVFMMAAYASIAESKGDWFVCLCMLLGPLVNWIPVLNPLVTIFTVTPYRKTLIRVGPSLPSASTAGGNMMQSKVFRRVSNISSDMQRQQQEEASRQKYNDKISTIAAHY